ncbi:hypothetical protein IFM89_034912 [Coptis chinensis]|uniref:Uncharacterized protein n=1 Tax=Coptis chinensis TaxID=261450 RepID=A0A835I6Z0_9MAGN|nr:hypothetical protein IFM89_034912 [Coptis chinensis]
MENIRRSMFGFKTSSQSGYCVSGHVHAYERSERISNIVYKVSNGNCTPVLNSSAPVYFTIGRWRKHRRPLNKFTEPQPSYSAYRKQALGMQCWK